MLHVDGSGACNHSEEWCRGNSQAHVHLEGVVNAPLQSGQGTDHDNTQRQSTRGQGNPAKITRSQLNVMHPITLCWGATHPLTLAPHSLQTLQALT